MTDLTDEELDRAEQDWRRSWALNEGSENDRKTCLEVLRLIAEVRRHRGHKCQRGGSCAECGKPTTSHRFCLDCL